MWCADITYIRLNQGKVYLMAVMDWYSRYMISWETSITLEVEFCLEALDRAIGKGCPEIFNTDQGSQFTSNAFTGKLDGAGIRISMDGRGRVFDNIINPIEEIVSLLKSKQLAGKPEMPIGIVEKLRAAVITSPTAENHVKEMLKTWGFNILTK